MALKRAGFRPRTVVDVGVAEGTPWLYETFPEAFHVLIDPMAEHEPHLQRFAREYGGQEAPPSASAENGTAIMDVAPGRPGKSPFLERDGAYWGLYEHERVEEPLYELS